MQSLNRVAGPSGAAAAAAASRARPWLAPQQQLGGWRRRPATATSAASGDGDGDAPPPPAKRRLSPGDRRRAQRAAVAARRAERNRSLLVGGRGRESPPKDDDDNEDADKNDNENENAASAADAKTKPLTAAEARQQLLALGADPSALAALERLEQLTGSLPPLQAAALLGLAQTQMSRRFDAAVASVEADGGGQLAGLFAAAAAAAREQEEGGSSSSFSIENERDALVADEALDRAIWEVCLSRALTGPQRAVLEKVVAGVPLRRAPGALARALEGGLDPDNLRLGDGNGNGNDEEDDDEEGSSRGMTDDAYAISRRLEALTEAEGVHLRRAVAGLASTLAALREAAFAVEGAEASRRRFEQSLSGMVADANAAEAEGDDNGDESGVEAEAAAEADEQRQQQEKEKEEDGEEDDNDAENDEDDDPLQRRLRAYSKYARVLAEGSPQEARALWYTAGGEPSEAFRALKDVVRRIVEVSLVAPELARHEAGRAEAAARAWREAAGGEENEDEENGEAERAARLAAEAYDAAHPEGAELSRAADKLRAARRALQRRASGGGEDDDDEDDEGAADSDDEEEASARTYRQLLAPLTDEEASQALESLSDELSAILEGIQEASGSSGPPSDKAKEAAAAKDQKGGGGNGDGSSSSSSQQRPTAAGRWAPRRAAGADARSAALYLAALTDDDGAFDACPENLARLCNLLRAAEALRALLALAEHSTEARIPDLAYGTERGTERADRANRAVADAFAERENALPLSDKNTKTPSTSNTLRPPRGGKAGAEAARLSGLDRDDWWLPAERRARAWAAVRAAEMDASFAGKAAAAAPKKGFGGKAAAKNKEAAYDEEQQSAPLFFGGNPYRALLRFADEGRIRELAALDADDILFLADMERCGWGDDDCLVKWTLHPRLGPRLRATATSGGLGGGVGGGDAGGGVLGSSAFFAGLPDSLRVLMEEARGVVEAEERRR